MVSRRPALSLTKETPLRLGTQLSMLGWTQEIMGGALNLIEDAIFRHFECRIPDLELVASRLELKNPVDLSHDDESPMSEVRR